jgi:hypothetical protein
LPFKVLPFPLFHFQVSDFIHGFGGSNSSSSIVVVSLMTVTSRRGQRWSSKRWLFFSLNHLTRLVEDCIMQCRRESYKSYSVVVMLVIVDMVLLVMLVVVAVVVKQSSPATRYGDACGDRRYSSYSFSTSALGVSSQHHAPAALYPRGKNPRYPLYRRLGGPQSRSGHRG